MTSIVLKDVEKSYGSVNILKHIDLEINTGELVVFVGPSGCGKSTLLRMIAGLEEITSGSLEIDGQIMNMVPAAKRGTAMVFQSYALFPHMTVRENMGFGLKINGTPKDEIKRKVDDAARMLQLEKLMDRKPKMLSGGQRQRVAIGRAIVRDPKVYLFDEPLSNLDAALRVATRIEIAQLKASMPGSTMIYVTHDQVEAMTLATRIVVLNAGGVAQVGTPLELYTNPNSVFVAQFIGSPSMNIMDGTIVETGTQTKVSLAGGGEAISDVTTTDDMKGAAVQVGIRPEHFIQPSDGQSAAWQQKVDFIEELGEVTLLYFERGGDVDPVIAKLEGINPGLLGQSVALTAASENVHLFKDGWSLRAVSATQMVA